MSVATRTPQPAKAVLVLRGLEQAQVAQVVGVTSSWLGLVLNGKQKPSADLARRLADYLEVPVEDLFCHGGDDIVIQFVRRTTAASNVPELLADDATAEKVAQLLKGGPDATTA